MPLITRKKVQADLRSLGLRVGRHLGTGGCGSVFEAAWGREKVVVKFSCDLQELTLAEAMIDNENPDLLPRIYYSDLRYLIREPLADARFSDFVLIEQASAALFGNKQEFYRLPIALTYLHDAPQQRRFLRELKQHLKLYLLGPQHTMIQRSIELLQWQLENDIVLWDMKVKNWGVRYVGGRRQLVLRDCSTT